MMVKRNWITTIALNFLCIIELSDAKRIYEYDNLQDNCAEVPVIENAQVHTYNIKPFVAEVECLEGYTLVGEDKLTCDNSTWMPAKLPYCKKNVIDLPPTANAGEDVVIYLPKNDLILNGNGSTDDKGILRYEWWNSGSDPVDMRGSLTPFLRLYNLEEGIYTFTLKVEDEIGQQSIDSVKVTVKPAFNRLCSIPYAPRVSFVWDVFGRTGVIRCKNEGYVFKHDGTTSHKLDLKCVNGNWRTSDGTSSIPDCVSPLGTECGDPPKVPHASVLRTSLNQVLYQCDEGYQSSIPSISILICAGSDWLGDPPKCLLKFAACQPPHSISNGHYKEIPSGTDISSDFLPGVRIIYECHSSYELFGNPILECLKDLTWSRHEPICIKSSAIEGSYCPPIPSMPNGECHCTGNSEKDLSFCAPFYPSIKVECSCDFGYRLVGTNVLTCTARGLWNVEQPTCVKNQEIAINTEGSTESSIDPTRMNTLAVVIATACSVLGILLLIMVVMIVRRRKPRPRHYHQVGIPPPYTRVHSSSFDELDRVALIGYDAARLPTYEEAVRHNNAVSGSQRTQGLSEVQVSNEFRPLPSIPNVVRTHNGQNNDIQSINSNRHSITTMSTVNRDGISEVFGSIDTVNYSLSDASTSVTVDTLDSATSHPSRGSGTATAGSVNTSNENISTEEAPLLENDRNISEDETIDCEIKDEDKD